MYLQFINALYYITSKCVIRNFQCINIIN